MGISSNDVAHDDLRLSIDNSNLEQNCSLTLLENISSPGVPGSHHDTIIKNMSTAAMNLHIVNVPTTAGKTKAIKADLDQFWQLLSTASNGH